MMRLLLILIACTCVPAIADDDVSYRRAMATAVRTASEFVLPSVVTIEVVGTSGAVKGEVAQDAPTSGVIVGHKNGIVEILASSIVLRRPAATILVVLPSGSRHAATVVARDNHRDLVLLTIKTDETVTVATMPNEIALLVGSTTIAIGRYGDSQSPTVSTGILSATGRLDGIALQTDARVSPAMYGGPLIDLYGNFLGVLIPAVAEGGAEDSTSWYDSGIAFAIPANVIAKKLDRLRSGQDINKGLIGIVASSRDANEADTTIAAVRVRSPAEAAGIQAGDKVMLVNGIPVRRHQQIKQALGSFDAGESVAIEVMRGQEKLSFEVTLADSIPPLQPQRMGIVVSQKETVEAGKTSVVIDAVVPGSPADSLLKVGDKIARIESTDVNDADLLRRQLITAEPDQEIELSILRDGKPLSKTLTVQSIDGPLQEGYPESWIDQDVLEIGNQNWSVAEMKLPDSANVAAILAPKAPAEGKRLPQNLGLLVILLEPGETEPKKVLQSWISDAATVGVVVVAIASEDAARWQAKELQVVANFAAAAIKKAPINSSAVAVAAQGALTSGKATAADSMAIAVAISQSETFFGVAIASDARPPAVRLRENEPSTSLQIMMPVKDADDLPSWAAAIRSAGYPMVLGGDVDEQKLMRWCRLLQGI
jgi:S1-C subfamily serine protease